MKNKIRRFCINFQVKQLKRLSADKIVKISNRQLIKSFKKTARHIPAYKKILKEHNIIPKEIKSIHGFRNKLPILDKLNYYHKYPIEEISSSASLKNLKGAMTSSGYSSDKYAFTIDTNKNIKKRRLKTDFALEMLFTISKYKTYLINCAPMGVHVDTSVCLSEPSVRSDMAVALIEKLGYRFEQIIIIGDPWFLKSLVEYGIEKKIDWQGLHISFVSGQDYFPESFRDYICHLTNLDIENDPVRTYITSMGLAEAGYNVFHETRETMKIRRAASRDQSLKDKLFNAPQVACPYLLNYYPFVTYLEDYRDNGDDLFIFSTINKDRAIPVMRYKSNDCGRVISYKHLSDILAQHKLYNMIPKIKLPCVTVSGRKSSYIQFENFKLYSEDIKLAIYEDFDFAGKITGYFRLHIKDKEPLVEVQLKEGIKPNEQDRRITHQIINKYMPVEIDTKIYPYKDFPYGMELNYEKKFITTDQN